MLLTATLGVTKNKINPLAELSTVVYCCFMGMRCNVLGKVLIIEKKYTKNGKEFWALELDVSGSNESEFPIRFSCWDAKLFSKLAEINTGQIVILDGTAKPHEYGDKVFVNWEMNSVYAYGSKGKQGSKPPQRETAPPKQSTKTDFQTEDEDDVPF